MSHRFIGTLEALRKELEGTYTKKALKRVVITCEIRIEKSDPHPEQALIDAAACASNKIEAIKMVRASKNLDLTAARDWVELNIKKAWGM